MSTTRSTKVAPFDFFMQFEASEVVAELSAEPPQTAAVLP